MSVITLQLGQCGNQVGEQTFSTLIDDVYSKSIGVSSQDNHDYIQTCLSTFFSQPESKSRDGSFDLPKARAVLVDMETKAVAQSLQQARKSGKWSYCPEQWYSQKRGSGNNWAYGYCVHGPRSQDDIMNLVRREVEKCDRLGGFINFLSLAGGTGSGVGAFVTQSLRDEYPFSFIVNQVVWPYSTGEVIVQNYNAVLTLSHLYDTADAILVMENDSLHKICSQLLNIKNISFRDINKVIAHKMTSVLQPSLAADLGTKHTCDLGYIVERLTPHPQHKLLTVKNIPQMSDIAKEFSTYQWPGLLKNLRQMLIADSPMEEGINWEVKPATRTESGHTCFNRSISTLLVLRGKETLSLDASMFSDPNIYAPWVPQDLASCVFRQPRWFCGYEKAATLVGNSSASVKPLNKIIDKAWNMFASRAYVHQYLKHGLTEEDFLDSFVSLEKVIDSYTKL
ncbi:tubulin delta chain-like [Biomphalaria glabrata]|uniref:Tubulin delta chain n=1 Tax=Biomphalaria glabrata TaxID=6526 RepID=A0A9W2YHY2_BIOGL|nr:tubulin delta chain-like [Biomphalaria glabrata]XP_055862331.1 tubulin delta chain-like [Biomphalaria glabrata]XP_055862332.1 tubulin delta chain-like [Biomphalaria glabrata]XP_055862333.1 tubulin delta chain-like [Biomphalaria glabrata]XP_055862334.1 tubulin delta chain-like [Biomphalaria glabrata]XP_055862335.1 tubulin delta chain-like [Biomphalaria glabrata]XP_055862336.1 tubulin delta chain-like [Biomphalaria glabrata]XP_055862337.1 tubulin delta chain-like [Biomphalaria glabrata]